ncbi:tRNA (adenosine(37)-N6)-threonylcarbamoyltransferase complex dimerization subunit type 1 TsaB [Candidatus Williamhamiltonella defendens]|uniref:tRNA (adenosine(37)-N6)-threonylcarbamoyltransferase complex dimerization subunit type 1 TsaB n=1 Tax=Candidatus Williamhamiltonella defendens TaxID=138072 RepID=UPI00130EB580|nr:tRNA (adenosine(37)-N6)-threonylcarbamoyltransferase complex dimerization subunit type 1 TsaB [Candidatus Hamiltonella defensa]
MPNTILAIDTTTDACSVAIWKHGEISSLSEICPRNQTQRILPMVQQILGASSLSLHQLDVLAFSRGPGSFTGVRLGIGVSQGLALGADLPMIGVSTLEILAQGACRQTGLKQVLVAMDARMGEIYWGAFIQKSAGQWQSVEKEMLKTPKQAVRQIRLLKGKWAYAGNAWTIYPDLLKVNSEVLIQVDLLLPQAEDMLPLAFKLWQAGAAVPVEQAESVYLRNNVAQKAR